MHDIKQKAQDLKGRVEKVIQSFNLPEKRKELSKLEADSMYELSQEGGVDESFAQEISRLEKKVDKFELKIFLSGQYDSKNAIVSIHAGQGGTEAMDWASMLYRMYLRYFEKKGWEVETVDVSEGEEAGLKSVTVSVRGQYAYGYLKGEAGTHRLGGQTPF